MSFVWENGNSEVLNKLDEWDWTEAWNIGNDGHAVGFGIATPQDAARVAEFADGVIVGSAIVRQIAEHQQSPDMPVRVGQFVRSLKQEMRSVAARA